VNAIFQREDPDFYANISFNGFDFNFVGHENDLDVYLYTVTRGDFSLQFAFYGIDSPTSCGPLSNLNFVHFIWDNSERLEFMKHVMLLFPYHDSRPPILLFLKNHRARSGGWTDIDGCTSCIERFQRDLRPYSGCIRPDRGSCFCNICIRQPPSLLDSASHILFQCVLDLERFELNCFTTYAQYRYAVQSGRVDDLRLLPPEFPFIRIWCRFHTFENKHHDGCPGRGEWTTEMMAAFVNVEAAVQNLVNNERQYWCSHCDKGLFFPHHLYQSLTFN
jgi:hypothetical protein